MPVRAALTVLAVLALARSAHAFVPLDLGTPRVVRIADADVLRAHAIGLADERVEGWASRCRAAEVLAEIIARRALHGYVDTILRDSGASPAAVANAHEAVEAGVVPRTTRTLVDCAASVEVDLPIARLREATAPWSMTW